MNLLDETIEGIAASRHSPEDIIFIGSCLSGHQCTWEEFCALANREYYNGYGAAEVAIDLRIVFRDGQQMWRGEYDGSEWWEFSMPFVRPQETKAIRSVFTDGIGWGSLAQINE